MSLILLKTEKNVIYDILDKQKYIVTWKSSFLQNVFKRLKRLKMNTLYSFRERKCK